MKQFAEFLHRMFSSHSFGKRRLIWRCSRTFFRWWPWRRRVRVRSGQRWELSLFERWHGHQHDVSVFRFSFTYHMVVGVLWRHTTYLRTSLYLINHNLLFISLVQVDIKSMISSKQVGSRSGTYWHKYNFTYSRSTWFLLSEAISDHKLS